MNHPATPTRRLRSWLLLLFVSSLHLVTAQDQQPTENWQSGYYLTPAGERVSGEIGTDFFEDRVSKVLYRSAAGAAVRTVPLSALTEFGAGNLRYLVREVAYNPAPRDLNSLLPPPGGDLVRQRGALQLLARGPLSLYRFVGPGGNAHYYVGRGNDIAYLPYGRYRRGNETGAGGDLVTDNSWRRMLAVDYMADCPAAEAQVRKTAYDRGGLVRLFKDYYDCTGATDAGVIRPNPKRAVLAFVPMVGVNVTQHDMSDNTSYSEIYEWDQPRTVSPIFGAQFRYRATARSPLAIKTGAFYHRESIAKTEPAVGSLNEGLTRDYAFEAETVDFEAGVAYRFLLRPTFSLSADLGLRHANLMNATELRTQDPRPGIPRRSQTLSETEPNGRLMAYGGLTAKVKRFEAALRVFRVGYEQNNTGRSVKRVDTVTRVSLMVGYRVY